MLSFCAGCNGTVISSDGSLASGNSCSRGSCCHWLKDIVSGISLTIKKQQMKVKIDYNFTLKE
jgi:hypothetical protein